MESPYKNGTPSAPSKSLWTAVTQSIDPQPSLTATQKVDVGIVGAGFTELTAALKLAVHGALVAVIEAAEVGWGASGRNNGLLAPGLKRDPREVRRLLGNEPAERLLRLSGDAPKRVFELVEQYGIRCDALNNGWIQAAHSRFALRAITRRVKDWQQLGADVSIIPETNVAQRLGTNYYSGATFDPRGGSLNPLAYVRGLAEAAGANIYTGTPMTELERDDGRWKIRTPDGALVCENILLCTNAYGNDIEEVRATVIPLRTAQVASEPMQENKVSTILPNGESASDTHRLLTSFRVTADKRLIMGGASATAGDESQSLIRHLHVAGKKRFPQLGTIRWQYGWSGYLALTPAFLPVIRRHEQGLYSGIGCNGRGIAMASVIGELLADLVSGSRESDCAVPVRPARRMMRFRLRRPGVAMAVFAHSVLDHLGRRFA